MGNITNQIPNAIHLDAFFTKKTFSMSLLDEKLIAENLKKVIDALGGRDAAAKVLKVAGNLLSNYSNLSGNKNPSNLVSKLIAAGINGNWYLTGEGKMFIREIREARPEDVENDEMLRQEGLRIQRLFERGYIDCSFICGKNGGGTGCCDDGDASIK